MNKTILYSLFIVLFGLWSFTATAKSITEQQAQSVATSFMIGKTLKPIEAKAVQSGPRRAKAAQPAYYVFNAASNGGYVIVSGDDRTVPVLGYADNGAFDPTNVPPALQYMLEGYAAQIDALDAGAQPALAGVVAAPISMLLKSQWSQSAPYNNKLPTYNGSRCVVGCVATAMAQIMRYHKSPASLPSLPAYTTSGLNISMPALSATNINWNAMGDFNANDNSSGAQAVATLSLYCAQSVQMNLSPSASGSSDFLASQALANKFGYTNARYVNRNGYSQSAWEQMIIDELQAGRPVMYSGQASGGHSFVCDGYDGNGRFHINWGWGGLSDGYFLLSVLNPYAQGTGGSNSAYGYINSQAIVIGIAPAATNNNQRPLYIEELGLENPATTQYTRSSRYEDFYVPVTFRIFNLNASKINFDHAYGIYDTNGNLTGVIHDRNVGEIEPLSGFSGGRSLIFGSGQTSGTYIIRALSKVQGTQDWLLCDGSDVNYLKVTINNNTVNTTLMGAKGEFKYQFNSAGTEGSLEAGRPMTIRANVTNIGTSDMAKTVYLFVDGNNTSQSLAVMKAGEQGEVTFEFKAPSAGNHTARFTLNSDGTNPFGLYNFTTTAGTNPTFTGSVVVNNLANASQNIVRGNKFKLTLSVANSSSATHKCDVAVKIFRQTSSTGGTLLQTHTRTVELAGNKTTSVDITSEYLATGASYFIVPYYYKNGTETRLNNASPTIYTFDGQLQTPIAYIDSQGNQQTCEEYEILSASTATLTPGWWVVNANVTNNNRLTYDGTVNLILADGATLTATKGINVKEDCQLHIFGQTNGTGTLTATGYEGSAGIGGECHWKSGTVVVNGGVVNATGDKHAAGIGGGDQGNWAGTWGSNGTVIINGGSVTAHSPGRGAGIGGGGNERGNNSAVPGDGGTVLINDGIVKATSQYGYGIGPGRNSGFLDGTKGSIKLSWTKPETAIEAKSYMGDLTFAKNFVVQGTITRADSENAGNKVIVPAYNITFKKTNQILLDAAVQVGEKFPYDSVPLVDGEAVHWLLNGVIYDFDVAPTGNLTLFAGNQLPKITYIDNTSPQAEEKSVGNVIQVTPNTTSFEDGKWYVVQDNVENSNRITVNGTAYLILADGGSLSIPRGIRVGYDKALTIYGQRQSTGKLTATGDELSLESPLGGSNHEHSGTIIIHGGVINVSSYNGAAAIGGGSQGYWAGEYGHNRTVVIYGGDITATSNGYGAGIGGGGYETAQTHVIPGNGGEICIAGGTVKASSTHGYAIGAGKTSKLSGAKGRIVIQEFPDGQATTVIADSYYGDINIEHTFVLDEGYTLATAENINNSHRIDAAYTLLFFDTDLEQIEEKGVKRNGIFPESEAPKLSVPVKWYIRDDLPFDFTAPVKNHCKLFAKEVTGLPGDVNGDGKVDVADINIIINIVLGKDAFADYPASDINGDNKCDVSDLNDALNIAVGGN